jgi:hypothetical protein
LTGETFPDGRGYDVAKLLGKPCVVRVGHKKSQANRVFARVEAVMPPEINGKPFDVRPPKRPLRLFIIAEHDSLTLPEYLNQLPHALVSDRPEPVLDIIRRSSDWKKRLTAAAQQVSNGAAVANGKTEDSVPF